MNAKIPYTDSEWKISLKGAPLSGLNLEGFNFTRADMEDAEVNGTNLAKAKFSYPPFLKYSPQTPPVLAGTDINPDRLKFMIDDTIMGNQPWEDVHFIVPFDFLAEYYRQNPGHEIVENALGYYTNIQLAKEHRANKEPSEP